MLKSNGFRFVRQGTKHEIWSNGKTRVSLSHGSNVAPRTLKSFLVVMKRARKEEIAICNPAKSKTDP